MHQARRGSDPPLHSWLYIVFAWDRPTHCRRGRPLATWQIECPLTSNSREINIIRQCWACSAK